MSGFIETTALWLNKNFYDVVISMETVYGSVAPASSSVTLVGSDQFVSPPAGLVDDYITDRRRRGKIERKSESFKSVKDKMAVSGYARQYCDKDKQSYYYKVREHIPQLYDTRNGQPPGKIVPERLFDSLVKANQTPINGNFMRIVGRSQAEDPRGRFNPADYMTSATTGQSEGFGMQKPVDRGVKTIFGQDIQPPAKGMDPSKPSGPDPGDLPPSSGGPSAGDDDDDDDDDGGDSGPGLMDRLSVWYNRFRNLMSRSGTKTEIGSLEAPPEMVQVASQAPVEQFQPMPLRRSGRERNQIYSNLGEDSMAENSGSVVRSDYTRNYNPQDRVDALMERQKELGFPMKKMDTGTKRQAPESRIMTMNDLNRDGGGSNTMTIPSFNDVANSLPGVRDAILDGTISAENLEQIQKDWIKNINSAIESITESNIGRFIRALNNLRNIIKFMVTAAAMLGAGRVVYNTYGAVGNAVGLVGQGIGAIGQGIGSLFSGEESTELPQEFYDQIREIIQQTPALDPRTGEPPENMQLRYLEMGSGQVSSIFPDFSELGLYNTGSETERPTTTVPVAYIDDGQADIPSRTIPDQQAPSTQANANILLGMISALFMGSGILVLLTQMFMRKLSTPTERIRRRGSLSERSQSISNLVRGAQSSDTREPEVGEAGPSNWAERPRRRRKIKYGSLNEREMSQKSGKEKDFSEGGI